MSFVHFVYSEICVKSMTKYSIDVFYQWLCCMNIPTFSEAGTDSNCLEFTLLLGTVQSTLNLNTMLALHMSVSVDILCNSENMSDSPCMTYCISVILHV